MSTFEILRKAFTNMVLSFNLTSLFCTTYCKIWYFPCILLLSQPNIENTVRSLLMCLSFFLILQLSGMQSKIKDKHIYTLSGLKLMPKVINNLYDCLLIRPFSRFMLQVREVTIVKSKLKI